MHATAVLTYSLVYILHVAALMERQRLSVREAVQKNIMDTISVKEFPFRHNGYHHLYRRDGVYTHESV